MTNSDYMEGLAFRIKHGLETKQTGQWIRAWILFLEAEMKADYYAFKIGWSWIFK
jgi:hypothetical protein